VKTLIHGQQGFKLTPDAPLAIEVPTVTSNSRDEKSKEGMYKHLFKQLTLYELMKETRRDKTLVI
jgi:hypothetical protein